MRLTAILLTAFCLQVSATTWSQKITFSGEKVRLEKVMKAVEEQTGFFTIYDVDMLSGTIPVSVSATDMPLQDFLNEILKDQPVTYVIQANTIFLKKKEQVKVSFIKKQTAPPPPITGVVLGPDGQPVAGASVQIKGTNKGTTTGSDGRFTLAIPDGNSNPLLEISYIGFQTKTVTVGSQTDINITLEQLNAGLADVVVVGYGTQRKRDLTGAVSQVNGDNLKNMPVRNATEALQGQSAGVQVTSTGGSPGTPPAVRIRGVGTINDNNPLYVVDGLPQSDIGWLNPNDIVSLEILKDASATAIYGARAANGVIMVTTAKGPQQGDKVKNLITFDTYRGYQNPVKIYHMMNASQFMDYKNLANENAGLPPFFTSTQKAEVLQFLKSNTGSEEGTNWWREINNKNAVVQNYDISVSGGTKGLSYRSSLNYMDQNGIINGSDFDRLSWRTNFNSDVKSWLKLSGNVGIINEGRGNVLEGSPGFNTAFIAFVADPISPVYRTNLVDVPGFLRDGLFLDRIDQNNPWSFYSPILMTNKQNAVAQTEIFKQNRWKGTAIKGGGAADVQIVEWLKFRSNFGVDMSSGTSDVFAPQYYLNGNQFNSNATVGASYSKTNYYVWENTLSLDKHFASHRITALVGTSAEQWKSESIGASRQGLVSNDPGQWIINAGSINPQASGFKWEMALNSYFSRLFYSFKSRYMLTANFRYDGSSNFGSGSKWGAFPSLSLGWNFSEESFFKNASWLSSGKLRASWGQIGNQSISRGAYQTTYSGNMGYYLFGDTYIPQLSGGVNSLGNSNVRWEQTEQIDIGMDLALLGNKLNVALDAYKKTTDGMLLNVPIPAYLGFPNSPWSNAGNVLNKGIELDVSYRNNIGEFQYTLAANASAFKNKVISLGGGEPISGGGWISYTTTKTEEGMPIGYFYGFKTDGIFQTQAELDAHTQQDGARLGDLRYVDVNNDGQINANDRTNIGNPFPKLTYGFRFSGEFRNFDLQGILQGTVGNKIMNIKKIDMNSGVGWYNAPSDLVEKAWSPTNPSNTQFAITASNQTNLQISDWLVEDGSYLRLKSLQLGYTLPKTLLSNAGIERIRLWVGGYNLLTFTRYSGLDPEIGNGSPLSMGVDQALYPQASTVMFGVNANF